jgi:hypothetical protein
VRFSFTRPEADSGETQLKVKDDGEWRTVSGTTYTLDTDEGGDRGCVTARAVTTYGWGTTTKAQDKVCGTAKPPSIWWTKDATCASKWQSYYGGACTTWSLHYKGLQPFKTYTLKLSQNGGSCGDINGNCTLSPSSYTSDGRGVWSQVWSAPAGWHEHFEARIGKMVAVLPN